MRRHQLEHVLRAAAATSGFDDIIVIGSQAILASFPDVIDALVVSMEADVYPRADPSRSIVIDGAVGELSMFHQTFGYYAHGVDDTTAILPDGWQTRLVKLHTPATMGAVGWCLEPHDLAVSKLAAGRGKDMSYVRTMLDERLIDADILRQRLLSTPRLHPTRLSDALATLNY